MYILAYWDNFSVHNISYLFSFLTKHYIWHGLKCTLYCCARKMIQLLFGVVMVEMALVMMMSFGSPIRKLLVKGLDLMKQGRGPLVTKTVAATMLVVFGSTLFTLTNIQKRVHETGVLSHTDEVLTAQRLLEASLIGKQTPLFSFLIPGEENNKF